MVNAQTNASIWFTDPPSQTLYINLPSVRGVHFKTQRCFRKVCSVGARQHTLKLKLWAVPDCCPPSRPLCLIRQDTSAGLHAGMAPELGLAQDAAPRPPSPPAPGSGTAWHLSLCCQRCLSGRGQRGANDRGAAADAAAGPQHKEPVIPLNRLFG